MKVVVAKLPEELYERLVRFCREKGFTKSEVIRLAVAEFLESFGY